MLSSVAIIPSTPVLVPELVGAAAGEFEPLRAAVLAAAATLPPRWLAVGVGETAVYRPERRGTFAGYGADVTVALGPGDPAAVTELPLCALITGWVRARVAPGGRAEVRCWPAGTPEADARAAGAALRAELDDDPEPVGVLIVADGLTTLTPSAPGGHLPESVADQGRLDAALAGGDAAALAGLPEAVVGRAGFAVLAGLVGPGPHPAREYYRGAPLGVGYFVGTWRP